MILCTQCQTENRSGAHFCRSCGAILQPTERPAATPLPRPADKEMAEARPSAGPAAIVEPTATPVEPAEAPGDDAETVPTAPAVVETLPVGPPADEAEVSSQPAAPELPAEIASIDQVEPSRPASLAEGLALEEPSPTAEAAQGDGKEPGEAEGEPVGDLVTLLPPLEIGTLLLERFEIVELLEETPATLLYLARDFLRCPQCDYADSQPGDVFCAHCGASLADPVEAPLIHLRSLRVAGEAIIQLEEESKGQIERWFESAGRLYAVLPVPTAEPATEQASLPFGRGVQHIVGYQTDPGLQRELNEDSILAVTLAPLFQNQSQPSLGLYAVADGMGGHASGEVASRLAIEELSQVIVKRLFLPELSGEPVLPETPANMLAQAIHNANARIYDLQQSTGSDMGTTLTVALVRDELALIANVGDSRAYLWRDGQLAQITTDHSLVAQLVEAGAIEPDDIYTHPEKSAIYRSLGHMAEIEVDVFSQSLQAGDRLLLCSDGVWEMLRPEGVEEVLLLEPDPQRACREIVRRANLAGGEDNIGVVIVQFAELDRE